MKPLLKICGLMREEDVELCCRKGVDFCGFVTEYPVPVPWNLSRERCAQLLPLVRGRAQSCIVTGGSAHKIKELVLSLRPDCVQLHGGETVQETAALVDEFDPIGIRVIKTIPVTAEARLREFGTDDPARCAELLDEAGVFAALVDARGPENADGAGLHADTGLYDIVRTAGRCLTILGGGINSENCAELILRLHPSVLDVMTGVEVVPGQKSEKMLAALIKAMEDAASQQ